MEKNDTYNSTGLVSPLDYRYGRKTVKKIFSEQERLKKLILVEYAAALAESREGLVPEDVSKDIATAIKKEKVTIEEVREVESKINHDIMSMVRVLSEKIGDSGFYVHYGLTSNDVNDTATALQLKEFSALFTESLSGLQDVLVKLTERYAGTPMLGRTHGQHASPITFGLKMAVFLGEINRHIERYMEGSSRFLAGKLMGPVGTGAFLGPKALRINRDAMKSLGLEMESNPTQLVGRDRYIEFLSIMNNISVTVEKLATEIRNLQRPEIGELTEHFNLKQQVGSSSMPSKKNPVDSETVCSLSRMVRTMITPEYEASIYWHERDLTNSALERFTIPYSCILTDFIVTKLTAILENIGVMENRMLSNLRSDRLSMSESVVKLLTLKGMSRQEAHETVRKISMTAGKSLDSYTTSILDTVKKVKLTRHEVLDALNPRKFLGVSRTICRQTVRNTDVLKKRIKSMEGDFKRTPL